MTKLLNCPRCGGTLRERGPNRKWKRFFECAECWATFEQFIERHLEAASAQSVSVKFLRHRVTLQPGRSRRKLYTLQAT